MTSSLPQQAREAFSNFVTTEYTTIGAKRQPITWPVTPYYTDGGATIDISTGLGYPKKADDAARNPKVSMLFSDPTGSGMEDAGRDASQVLVQGIAEVDDADLGANSERYIRESGVKLPATKKMNPPKPVRALIGWYYKRIYVLVRPERVFVWPGPDSTVEPEVHDCHLEEVRSGHAEEPQADHGVPIGGPAAWDDRVDQLGRDHETAVVSWLAPDGFPLSVRLRRGRRRCQGGRPRRRARRSSADRGPGLPDRTPPRPRLHLAEQLPGARRPGAPSGGLAPRPAQAGRRLTAEGRARTKRPVHEADGPLLPDCQETNQGDRGCGLITPHPRRA